MHSPQKRKVELDGGMQIAFVSSCLPRKCGFATFSAHLSQTLEKNWGPSAVAFIALNNNRCHDYSPQGWRPCLLQFKSGTHLTA